MSYHWREQRAKQAYLALACGEVFHGWSFGAEKDGVGEVVFNTGMTGYQEIVSDPSYAGQFVTLTCPEIGNYGCNASDMESRALFFNGLVVREYNEPSNFRSEESLRELLLRFGKPGIAGIDTRRLTTLLRTQGSQKAFLHVEPTELDEAEAIARAAAWEGLDNQDYAAQVSAPQGYRWNDEGDLHLVAVDFGIKYNILRNLAKAGFQVDVVPAHTTAEEILKRRPDGVFLSNGPADPSALPYAAEMIRGILGKVPVMGICLGHQLLGIASGAKCARLKFGHHGCNHPVKNLASGAVEITSQNHNFALQLEALPECLEVTHMNLNDNTIEGIRRKDVKAFSVQYHPEAAPGPHDAEYLFGQFRTLIVEK